MPPGGWRKNKEGMPAMDGDGSNTKARPTMPERFSIEELLKGPLGDPAARHPSPDDIARRSESYDVTEFANPANAPAPPPKKSDPLPRPGDAYRAHARFLSQLSSEPKLLHFVRGDFTCEGFRYTDLRRLRWLAADKPGQGPAIVLRFVEAEITDVRIDGRHLDDVHHWIGEGLMPWLWEQPPGFHTRDDAATVITRITISEAKRRMSGDD
jgi:hypothetical protein